MNGRKYPPNDMSRISSLTQPSFNMPTDHATVTFSNVWVPSTAMLGPLNRGLSIAQAFVHENRIRQAASSLGAAQYCIEESIKYARTRKPFGQELAKNQAITFPVVELAAQASMLELLILKTASRMDGMEGADVERELSGEIGMCNYYANRWVSCLILAQKRLSFLE